MMTKEVKAYLHGGLGNQCFIYAAARALALRANAKLRLNIDLLQNDGYGRKFALEPFAGIPPVMSFSPKFIRKVASLQSCLVSRLMRMNWKIRTYPCEKRPPRYLPLATQWFGRLTLRNGYWQSEKYFEDCRSEILNDFCLKDDAWLKSDALARRIEATENSVFLHVRTYKEVNGNEDGCCAIRMRDYYRNALMFLSARLPSATVFVFSDDVEWTRRNVMTKELLSGMPFDFVYDTGGGGASGLYAHASLPAWRRCGQLLLVVGGMAR